MVTRSLILALAAALSACGGGGSDSAGAPAPQPGPAGAASVLTVDVASTDPAVSTAFGSTHYAYINRGVGAKNRLFLFFGATDAPPKNYQLIGTAAADAGFHSLGLAYPNGPQPVNSAALCGGSTDPDCTGKIREEVLSGSDASPLISVGVADSVQNRLVKALTYLDQQYPADGWGQYLDRGAVRWDLVRVSGLSQGGGLAGYIAKKFAVDRACFFSSPADWDTVGGQPAAWILRAGGATPASRIFGFNDQIDPVVFYPRILETWTAFGLDAFGAPVDVDTTTNYGGSHELNTAQGTVVSAHTSTAADSTTPLDGTGAPAYLPVWKYACFN